MYAHSVDELRPAAPTAAAASGLSKNGRREITTDDTKHLNGDNEEELIERVHACVIYYTTYEL